mgnify:CR=1 FL=1
MADEHLRMERQSVDAPFHFLYPRFTVLLSAGREDPNVMTASWSTPLSIDPPLVGVVVAPERHTHGLVEEDGAFGVNVPDHDLVEESYFVGRNSGADVDKFAETGLTTFAGEETGTPLIEECAAALECSLEKTLETGDHEVLVGRVEATYAHDDAVEDDWLATDRALFWGNAGEKDVYGAEPR